MKPYTEDEQHLNFGCGDFAPFVFYIAHAGSAGLPADINQGIKPSCFSNRIGGNTYVLAASPAS